MNSNLWLVLLVIGVIIIAVLAFIAGKLLRQLRQQKLAQQQVAIAKEQALKKHDSKIIASVVIIVKAMQEEQCDLSEGCWRLSVLLDSLKLSRDMSAQFPAIFQLYQAIKHMPILEERKKLAKPQRMKLDFERMKLEAQLHQNIQKDLDLLQQYAIERASVLQS